MIVIADGKKICLSAACVRTGRRTFPNTFSFLISISLGSQYAYTYCTKPAFASVSVAASLLGAMDLSADPCDNFFQFACGNWNKQHMIPDDRSSISTFEVLSDQIQVILKGN